MKIYSLNNRDLTCRLITENRDDIFEEIINQLEGNKAELYLTVWEDDKMLYGKYVSRITSEHPNAPVDCLVNRIIDNKI